MTMLLVSIILFVVAICILFVDVYIEGFGVLGIVGIAVAAVSIFLSIAFIPFGIYIVLGKIAIMIPGTFLFFKFLKARQLDGRLVLTETLAEDKIDVSGLLYFLGKEGITKTALRPQGSADFNGTSVDVLSDSKYIPAGKRVKVVDVKDRKVTVSLIEN